MLTFDKTGFSIRIETGINPVEGWLELHNELLMVLSMLDMENNVIPTPYNMLSLLIEMMPDWQTAKQMTDK